jgi:hypothetical protein
MQLSSWKSCLAELETDLKMGGPTFGSPRVDMFLEVIGDSGE